MDKFFEYFKIPKIEYRTPGRTYSEDGECCEYYIEKDCPSFEPVFFELLSYYNTNLNGEPLSCEELNHKNLGEILLTAILERVLLLEQKHDMSKEKQDILEIFTDYYKGEIYDD